MKLRAINLIVVFLTSLTMAPAADTTIDVTRSTITIHVGKTGLLSAAGHDHWISAPISTGTMSESPTPHIEFTVAAAKMAVKPDPKVDAKTQAEIQKDMEEMTLETKKFPEITFRSSRIETIAGGQWKVRGDLTLHGVTKPVTLTVKRAEGAYTTRTVLKQTDFAIQPASAVGGMVKAKNEVEIDFKIVPR